MRTIYASIYVQIATPVGSPTTRNAINPVYSDIQQTRIIISMAIMAFDIVGVFMWRCIEITNIYKRRGLVIQARR